ncbi:MAG: globin-coupled sensor protein [Bacillus sp. (in: firmicutes)]
MAGCPFGFLHRNKGDKESIHSSNVNSNNKGNLKLTINNQDLSVQTKFVGLTEQDMEFLIELRPIMEKNADRIVTAFYRNLQQIPHLINIINEHSTIDRLKKTLTHYLLEMVSGKIDERYIENRIRIGKIHNKIKLFPEWYIGAYTLIQNEMFVILTNEKLPLDKAKSLYLSFQKLCSFDMQIGISTYIESYTSSMMKLNEIHTLQQQLDDSAATLAAGAEETTSAISDKENLVNQMLIEINEINTISTDTLSEVELGKQEVASSLEQVDEVVTLIEETKHLTKHLTESSKEIGAIVQTIRGISNQTNILSLNAAIEAQRAGIHGKGFSVVAKEVRKLATETQKSLDNIHGQISMVQRTVGKFESSYNRIAEDASLLKVVNEKIISTLSNTVDSVKHSSEKIQNFHGIVDEFQRTFEEITGASYQVAQMAEQLNEVNHQLSLKLIEDK